MKQVSLLAVILLSALFLGNSSGNSENIITASPKVCTVENCDSCGKFDDCSDCSCCGKGECAACDKTNCSSSCIQNTGSVSGTEEMKDCAGKMDCSTNCGK